MKVFSHCFCFNYLRSALQPVWPETALHAPGMYENSALCAPEQFNFSAPRMSKNVPIISHLGSRNYEISNFLGLRPLTTLNWVRGDNRGNTRDGTTYTQPRIKPFLPTPLIMLLMVNSYRCSWNCLIVWNESGVEKLLMLRL